MNTAIEKLENFNYKNGILSGTSYNIGESVLVMPVWTEEFCDLLIDAAETLDYNPLDSDMGEYGAAPGQEVRTSTWSEKFLNNWKKHCYSYLFPIIGEFYQMSYVFDRDIDLFRDPFIIKYDMDGQRTLDQHHDTSLFTFNMTFSKIGRDYTGSDVIFPRQNWSNRDIPRGWATVFPGQVTHPHYTNPITSGTRYGWVSWIRGSDLENAYP